MLKKTRQVLAQLAVLFEPEQAELASILTLGMGRSGGDAAALLGKCEEGMIKVLSRIEELTAAREKELIEGFAWTLKCIRSGAASAAAAIDISLSKIRRQGDWSASSMVPERKYIDAMVVSTDAARRFFGWLSHGA